MLSNLTRWCMLSREFNSFISFGTHKMRKRYFSSNGESFSVNLLNPSCIENGVFQKKKSHYHCDWYPGSLRRRQQIISSHGSDYFFSWGDHYNDVIMGTIASHITSLTIVYSIVYSDADQRKHQSSASLAFVRGIHRGPVNSPHKWPVTRKMFPFDDVIMMWMGDIDPDSKVHGANMGPILGQQDPVWPYVDPMKLATWEVQLHRSVFIDEIRVSIITAQIQNNQCHGCWWPGDARRSLGADYFLQWGETWNMEEWYKIQMHAYVSIKEIHV